MAMVSSSETYLEAVGTTFDIFRPKMRSGHGNITPKWEALAWGETCYLTVIGKPAESSLAGEDEAPGSRSRGGGSSITINAPLRSSSESMS